MASFPNDPEEYRYHRIVFFDGRRSPKRKTVYLKKSSHYGKAGFTRSEALDWKKRREIMFDDGEWDPWDETSQISKDQAITLEEAIRRYFAHARRELAESTLKSRKEKLHQFRDTFGGKRALSSLDPFQLEEWINEPHLMYKSKMKRLEVVKALFGFAAEQGWAPEPELSVYAKRSEKKRAKRKDKTWVEPDEYQKCKDAAQAIHRRRMDNNFASSPTNRKYREFEKEFDHIFDFLINTGLRRSDFIHLSTDWFIADCSMMRIGDDDYTPKSKEPDETIPLTPEAREIARRWIDKYGRETRPFIGITRDWFTKFFKDVFRKALPKKADKLSAHKMRDSAAMYLLFVKRYSVQTVQQITRHEDLSTLMIYTHWAPKEALKEIDAKK